MSGDVRKAQSPVETNATDASKASLRILRKRETDRRYQRKKRDRRQHHVSSLEALLDELKSQDADGRLAVLTHRLAAAERERDLLRQKLDQISALLSEPTATVVETQDPSHHSGAVKDLHANSANLAAPRQTKANYIEVETLETRTACLGSPETSHLRRPGGSTASPTEGVRDSSHSPETVSASHIQIIDKWRFANDTLTKWLRWQYPGEGIAKSPESDNDTPIRMVAEDCASTDSDPGLSPSWALLKDIDKCIFEDCDKRERLAVMVVMGWLLHAHLDPSNRRLEELPAYYTRACLPNLRHMYAIEFFVWPGVRTLFKDDGDRYFSNHFWRLFIQNFRVAWPWHFRKCYTYDGLADVYRISPEFRDCLRDIRCWTVNVDMFEHYPELRGAIPSWNALPISIELNDSEAMDHSIEPEDDWNADCDLQSETISEFSMVQTTMQRLSTLVKADWLFFDQQKLP